MAILRAKEIRAMSLEELDEKIREMRDELSREKTIRASGGSIENPGRMKEIRRTLARLITIKRERGVL